VHFRDVKTIEISVSIGDYSLQVLLIRHMMSLHNFIVRWLRVMFVLSTFSLLLHVFNPNTENCYYQDKSAHKSKSIPSNLAQAILLFTYICEVLSLNLVRHTSYTD
jgi:hypothetical protein